MKDILPVGVSFHKEAVEKIKVGDKLKFKHEPVFTGKKEYPNAIAIYANREKVGHLAESDLISSPQQRVLMAIKAGKEVVGEVTELIIPSETDSFKRTFSFDIDLGNKMFIKSFNEDVIVEFDEDEHVYEFNGKKLLSGSVYADDDDFDKQQVAGYCAKSWDMKADDVVSMWDSNADISRDFGTVVHKMLEHFNKYSKLLPAKEIERAKPKHPFLKKILNDYIDTVGIKKIEPEVFITYVEDGYCGQVDCLEITGEKKCNLWDYKINILRTEKDKDGKKKLLKVQKQLSFYANILEKTGWQVDEIGMFLLDEKWEVYKFDKSKIDKSKIDKSKIDKI